MGYGGGLRSQECPNVLPRLELGRSREGNQLHFSWGRLLGDHYEKMGAFHSRLVPGSRDLCRAVLATVLSRRSSVARAQIGQKARGARRSRISDFFDNNSAWKPHGEISPRANVNTAWRSARFSSWFENRIGIGEDVGGRRRPGTEPERWTRHVRSVGNH